MALSILGACASPGSSPEPPALIDDADVALFESEFVRHGQRCGRCFDATEYFARGGHGLQYFRATERVLDQSDFEERIVAEWDFYTAFLADQTDYQALSTDISDLIDRFAKIYPTDRIPTVYITVGQTYSGGTASERGVVVAAEAFGASLRKTSYGRPTIDNQLLVPLIAHELVHYHQKLDEGDGIRLVDVIAEGGAEYVAEMLVGPSVRVINSPSLYPFGFENYDDVVAHFKADYEAGDLSGWLYSNDTPLHRDIGYFAGYCIAKTFVERAHDRSQAIAELIELRDPDSILQRSGFLEGRSCSSAAVSANGI